MAALWHRSAKKRRKRSEGGRGGKWKREKAVRAPQKRSRWLAVNQPVKKMWYLFWGRGRKKKRRKIQKDYSEPKGRGGDQHRIEVVFPMQNVESCPLPLPPPHTHIDTRYFRFTPLCRDYPTCDHVFPTLMCTRASLFTPAIFSFTARASAFKGEG